MYIDMKWRKRKGGAGRRGTRSVVVVVVVVVSSSVALCLACAGVESYALVGVFSVVFRAFVAPLLVVQKPALFSPVGLVV